MKPTKERQPVPGCAGRGARNRFEMAWRAGVPSGGVLLAGRRGTARPGPRTDLARPRITARVRRGGHPPAVCPPLPELTLEGLTEAPAQASVDRALPRTVGTTSCWTTRGGMGVVWRGRGRSASTAALR